MKRVWECGLVPQVSVGHVCDVLRHSLGNGRYTGGRAPALAAVQPDIVSGTVAVTAVGRLFSAAMLVACHSLDGTSLKNSRGPAESTTISGHLLVAIWVYAACPTNTPIATCFCYPNSFLTGHYLKDTVDLPCDMSGAGCVYKRYTEADTSEEAFLPTVKAAYGEKP